MINLGFYCFFFPTFTDESEANEKSLDEPAVISQNDEIEIERVEAESEKNFTKPMEEEKPVEEVKSVKVSVSTGCGPSPDREIEEIFANENAMEAPPKAFTPLREIPGRSSRVSIGTSPPPQSISTQVCQ